MNNTRRALQMAYCYILAYGHQEEFLAWKRMIGSAELITPTTMFPELAEVDTPHRRKSRRNKRRRREFT